MLLEADVGLSLHPDTAEARLAYRSRLLDYVWAGLPMVVTRGDALADYVAAQQLGIVVDYGDEAGVADAVSELLTTPRHAYEDRFARARTELTWEVAAKPLICFCENPHRAADRLSGEEQARADPDKASLAPGEEEGLLAEREREIVRLRELVAAYERGRFMRLMRRVHRWREKLRLP